MKAAVRQEFQNLPHHVNWYPGHMRKAIRTIGPELKKVNFFVEVRDARLPITSYNSEIDVKLKEYGIKKAIVLSKFDLCHEKQTMAHISKIKDQNPDIPVLHVSSKNGKNVGKLLQIVKTSTDQQFRTVGSWLMIGGVPNVGKSTIINALRNKDIESSFHRKSGAKTGGRPCITKSMSGFKIVQDPLTYMVDTPGIIMPKITPSSDEGLKL
jgi:ribosome biogenesis GTPase A